MAARLGLDREQVIDAAVELLEERGSLDGLVLADLASRLGIRTQSLYAHVDGADGLRRDLAIRGLDALADRLSAAAMGRSGRDALESILRAWLGFAEECPGLYRATLRPPGDDTALTTAITATTRPLRLVLRSYGLSERAVTHWYRIMFAAVYGFASLRDDGMFTMPADPDETVRIMIDMFADRLETEVGARGSTPPAPARR